MCLPPSIHLQKRFKFPNASVNLIHQREPDVTDLIFYNTSAVDGGESMAHIFVVVISCLSNVFEVKTPSAECFLGALQDWVCIQGSPIKLLSNNAGMYCSWRITCYSVIFG